MLLCTQQAANEGLRRTTKEGAETKVRMLCPGLFAESTFSVLQVLMQEAEDEPRKLHF